MDDPSALRDLLARAQKVFELAGELGRAFREEMLGDGVQDGAAGWKRHKPAFEQFGAAVLELRDAINHPPSGFESVAAHLREAARIAGEIRDGVQTASDERYPNYAKLFPHLYSLAEDGRRAVNEATKVRRLDDPFAGLDELANATPKTNAAEPDAAISALLDAAVELDQAEQNERVRQFWIQGGMPGDLTYEQGQIWAQQEQAKKDAAEKAWRGKVTDLERCIEARCRQQMLAAGFRDDEMQGAYLPCLPGYVAANDPRAEAYKAALARLTRDERAKFRLLGCPPDDLPPEGDAEKPVVFEFSLAELQEKEKQRASREESAGESTRRERENRERLQEALGRIYVNMPLAGEPVDYARWLASILAFANAARDAGAVEFFLQAKPERQDVREALSVIQAALTGGAKAVSERMNELHDAEDPRAWMRVFNHSDRFWAALKAEPQINSQGSEPPAIEPPAVEIVDSGQNAHVAGQAKKKSLAGKGGRPKLTVNERMKAVLNENHEARGWTVSQWQEQLKASRAAIHATETWKALTAAHNLAKAQAAMSKQPDRRRRKHN